MGISRKAGKTAVKINLERSGNRLARTAENPNENRLRKRKRADLNAKPARKLMRICLPRPRKTSLMGNQRNLIRKNSPAPLL